MIWNISDTFKLKTEENERKPFRDPYVLCTLYVHVNLADNDNNDEPSEHNVVE